MTRQELIEKVTALAPAGDAQAIATLELLAEFVTLDRHRKNCSVYENWPKDCGTTVDCPWNVGNVVGVTKFRCGRPQGHEPESGDSDPCGFANRIKNVLLKDGKTEAEIARVLEQIGLPVPGATLPPIQAGV